MDDEINRNYYSDIIYDWLDEVRAEFEQSGSIILHRERTHDVPSIFPCIIDIIEDHMTFKEEYLEIDDTVLVENDDYDDDDELLNDWKD